MRVFQIRGDIDVTDADQRTGETQFARNNSAQLSFHNFVDAQHAVFHGTINGVLEFWSSGGIDFNIPSLGYSIPRCLESLRDRFKLIALDDVAYLIFAEVAELNSTFQARAHFLHVILKAP